MLQKYFECTMISKAIKYILSQTPLPMYKTITSDEYIYEGCTYIYRNYIIKCTSSGMFIGINSQNYLEDYLYVCDYLTVSNDPDYITKLDKITDDDGRIKYIYKSDYITVTNNVVRKYLRPFATFEVLDTFTLGEFKPGVTQTFFSNTEYYDAKTHKYLGEYLRCLRDIKGLDIMSLYNCFDYNYINNLSIQNGKVVNRSSNSKVVIIPIKYNRTYTIAIDSLYPVYMTSIIYNNGLMEDLTDKLYLNTDKERENKRIYRYNSLQFSEPVTYQIKENSADVLKYEKYLYLLIELPKNNDSSIVVLEGDFTLHANQRVSNIEFMNELSDNSISNIFKSELSLLQVNDKEQHPFSDKLVSYLLQNTIDSREMINENITRIEDKVNFHPMYPGNWNNKFRYLLYANYMDIPDHYDYNKKDILGFIDKDIEEAIWKGMIKNGK